MMIRYLGRTLIVILLITATGWAEKDKLYRSPITLINDDFQSGVITLDEKAMLKVDAIRHFENLPSKYKSHENIPLSLDPKGATSVLLEVISDWSSYNSSTQASLSASLSRNAAEFSYITPSGYFKLHYDTSGTKAVPALDNNLNNIPDFIENCAAYCDTTLDVHLALGYATPPDDGTQGGDSLYDIYFEDTPLYGYSVPEGPGPLPWNDYISYIVLNRDFLGFDSNTDPEGNVAGAAKSTIAHEFHHAVQMGYNAGVESWYLELDATCMEDVIFDQVNDNYNYLPLYMNYPNVSLMDNGAEHKYASFIWGIYLIEKFDISLLLSIWEGARYDDIYSAMSDSLTTLFNWTPDSAFVDFTYWNYFTDNRDYNGQYSEASNYPLIVTGNYHNSYPVSLMNSPTMVSGYAANYVAFDIMNELGDLKLTFNGSDSRQWAAYVIKLSQGNTPEMEMISLSQSNYYGEIEIPTADYDSVILVGVNIDEFSDGVLFTYQADIIPPYEVAVGFSPIDSIVYSGGQRAFNVNFSNISTVSDVVSAVVFDSNGWMPMANFDKVLGPGESSEATFYIKPPAGTSINDYSLVYIKAVSLNDPNIYDLKTQVFQSYLQRGDVDFTGVLDIDDIVYLVEYSFGPGDPPEPLPVIEAGDFDCNGRIDIDDLVDMINYAFGSGDKSPCNPY